MNLPNIKYGNCFIHTLLFKLLNFRKSTFNWKIIIHPSRKIPTFSFNNTYYGKDKTYNIYFRSNPKRNGFMFLYKGRAQIVDKAKLDKLLENKK